MTATLLGRHDGMSNEDYHQGPGVSKSHLDVVARSPAHYWHAYVNPEREPREATAAMVIGSAIHCAILEPDEFTKRYVCAPEEAPKRPSERQVNAKKPSLDTLEAIAFWQDFDAQSQGKEILTREQWDTAQGAGQAVRRHAKAAKLLAQGRAEESFFATDEDTGLLIKCRTDWRDPGAGRVIDVKSTEDASPDAFVRSVFKYRYHVQVPWYIDTMRLAMGGAEPVREWVFLAIEKSPPYAVGLYTLPPEMVDAGRRLARRNLETIADCRMLDAWPDFGAELFELPVPGWMRKQLGLDSPEQDFD